MENASKGWDSRKIAQLFDEARGNQFATCAKEPRSLPSTPTSISNIELGE
jgi:hypothetical protein